MAAQNSSSRVGPRPRSLSEWFRTRCRPLPLVLGAAMLCGPVLPSSIEAAPPRFVGKDANPKPTESDLDPQDQPPVKLNYIIPTTWEKILKDVAEQSGSVLVADKVPRGTYSRRDRNEYTREEALRVVNQEIEKLGFRAIEKGEFIVVLDLPSQRPRYERPTVPQPGNFQPPAPYVPISNTGPQVRQFDRVTPTARQQPAGADVAAQERYPAQEPSRPMTSGRTESSGRSDQPVRPVNHERLAPEAIDAEPMPAQGVPRSSAEDLLLDKSSARGTSEATTVVVFRARNQRAATLAKHVFKAFRDRAELLQAGRSGLPAFRVRSEILGTPDSPVQFSVAIDEAKEELLVDARPKEAEAMLKLLRLLDTPTLQAEPVHLVTTTRTASEVATKLETASEKIQKIRRDRGIRPAQFVRNQRNPFLDDEEDNQPQPVRQPQGIAQPGGAQPGADPQPANAMVLPRGVLGDIVGNLKGEVTIESVTDLGTIILRGNREDVEKVMQVIRELEKLSDQTSPNLSLLLLENVNSDALAELLTTVYESLTRFPGRGTQPRQSVTIMSITTPNALLIIAPAADMEGIKQLAEDLDQPVAPDTEFQVFHLETAVATQVEAMLTQFFTTRGGLAPRILIRADVRTNSVVVSARPNDLDQVAQLIRKIDRIDTINASQMRVFPLQNAVATELSAVLNLAIQSVISPPSSQGATAIFGAGAGVGGAQVSEEFRAARSSVLQFLAVDAAGEKVLKSGVLADIRITPDPRMNSLLVAAPEASMTLLSELIKQLDKPTNQVAEIKVFTLANADATLMVQQLQALFNAGTAQQGGQARQQLGVLIAGAEDANSGLIPLRFSVDTRTNSVIAIGGGDALRVVEAIMLRLDESDLRERRNTIYRLKNSPSDGIATAITNFFTSQRNLMTADPNLVSSIEQLEREVIVVSEPVSNSLMISATPRYNEEILRLIEKLDAAPQQVVIQALLVEVELNDVDEFGIELGFQDSILFNRSIIDNLVTTTTTTTENNVTVTQTNVISQSSNPGYLWGNPATPLGNNTTPGLSTSRVGPQSLSNFSMGRTNGELGFGGLVLSASSESVSMLLRALSENRQVRVLSRPQIRTLDNQQAQIVQGQEVPVVDGVTLAGIGGVPSPQVVRQEAGVILNVTPRISPDGNVVMALVAEKSEYNLQGGVVIFTDAATGNTVTAPVKDMSTATTTVSVPSGQTIVLGGLITSRTDEVHRKVPWLGDIPILGYAFRYDFLRTRRTELLIFLTPRIIWDDAESEHIKDVEMARMHFIEGAAEEIHGPLRGVPSADGRDFQGGYDAGRPMMIEGLPPGATIKSITPIDPSLPQPLVPPAPMNDPSAVPGIPPVESAPALQTPNAAPPARPDAPPPPAELEGARWAPRRTQQPGGTAQPIPTTDDDDVIPVGGTTSSSNRSRTMIRLASAEVEETPARPIAPPRALVEMNASPMPVEPRGADVPVQSTSQRIRLNPTNEPPASSAGTVRLGRNRWSAETPAQQQPQR